MISALGQRRPPEGIVAMSAQAAQSAERDAKPTAHMRTRGLLTPTLAHAAGIATKIGLSSGLPRNVDPSASGHEIARCTGGAPPRNQ